MKVKLGTGLRRWWQGRSIHQEVLATTSVALVLFFGSLVLFAQTTNRLLAILHRSDNYEQTLAVAKNLRRLLVTVEMGVWAYAGSGRADFLRAYRIGQQAYQADIERVYILLSAAPEERKYFEQATRYVDQWHTEFAARAIARQRAGRNGQDILAAAKARDSLQLFQDKLEIFADRQRQQVRQLRTEADAMVRRMIYLGLFLSVIGILGTLWLSSWLARSLTQPLAQLRQAVEDVEAGSPSAPLRFARPLEMARLAEGFNRMVSTLHQSHTELVAFQTFTEQLRWSQRVEEMRRVFLQTVSSRFHPQQALLLASNSSANLLEVTERLVAAPPRTPTVIAYPENCPAVRSSKPYGVTDPSREAVCECELDVPRAGSYACLPLQSGGTLLGLACLTGPPQHWTEDRRQHALRYAEQLASELYAHKELSQAQKQAMVDDLTHLYNRRFAEEYLQKLLALSRRTHRPFSVLLMDLDHFKTFNDCFGHLAGDRLLRAFSITLLNSVRRSAIAARWGGEEFLVVLPEVDQEGARLVAERVRVNSAQIRLEDYSVAELAFTVSIGVAVFPLHGNKNGELLSAADKALYRAKKAGRNRVEFAPGVPSMA